MAIPTFVGEGTTDAVNNTSDVQPTNPSSLAVDDILVGWMVSGDDDKTMTFPAGWTKEHESPDAEPVGGKGSWGWRRVTNTAESDDVITFTQTGNIAQLYAGIFALRGCETSGNPFDQSLLITADPNDLAEMAAITTTGIDRKLICIAGCEDNRSAKDTATNYTMQYEGTTTVGTDAAYGIYFQDAASATLYAADSAGFDGFGNVENHTNFTIDFKPPGVTAKRRISII